MTMAKKLASGTGTRSGSLCDGLGQRDAERLGFGDDAELGLDRLGSLVGDDADAVVERQPGLHAADDDVHGVGEFVEEFLHAALAEEIDDPARQADQAGERRRRRRHKAARA